VQTFRRGRRPTVGIGTYARCHAAVLNPRKRKAFRRPAYDVSPPAATSKRGNGRSKPKPLYGVQFELSRFFFRVLKTCCDVTRHHRTGSVQLFIIIHIYHTFNLSRRLKRQLATASFFSLPVNFVLFNCYYIHVCVYIVKRVFTVTV